MQELEEVQAQQEVIANAVAEAGPEAPKPEQQQQQQHHQEDQQDHELFYVDSNLRVYLRGCHTLMGSLRFWGNQNLTGSCHVHRGCRWLGAWFCVPRAVLQRVCGSPRLALTLAESKAHALAGRRPRSCHQTNVSLSLSWCYAVPPCQG